MRRRVQRRSRNRHLQFTEVPQSSRAGGGELIVRREPAATFHEVMTAVDVAKSAGVRVVGLDGQRRRVNRD